MVNLTPIGGDSVQVDGDFSITRQLFFSPSLLDNVCLAACYLRSIVLYKEKASSNELFLSLQPVSWLSFLLLLVTGGGILMYYDKEKKRHMEGTLLW
jgi:hypothetical protein